MDNGTFAYSLAAVAITAVITALTRALPFLLFGRSRRVPDVLHYLGSVLPAVIMIILVLYCLRSVSSVSGPAAGRMLGTSLLVVLLQWFGKNTVLSIAAGTAVYMWLVP